MYSALPRAAPSRRRPSCSGATFFAANSEQITIFFVYSAMKLLILGLLALAVLTAANSHDCLNSWSSEAREHAREAREHARAAREQARAARDQAREEVRAQARELHRVESDEARAWRDTV